MSVYFYAPTTTYSDPCEQTPVDPPIGPSVDDLIQALRDIPNITSTEPVAATFGGLPATYLEMTSDDTLPCPPAQFYIWDGNWTQGEGQIVRTWVLEVNGSRIVASALRVRRWARGLVLFLFLLYCTSCGQTWIRHGASSASTPSAPSAT